jgi:hypothetical protein
MSMKQAAPIASRTDTLGVTSFVEWGAVLAGAVLAAALSFVLLTFGAAIGLSAASPWPNSGLSLKVIATVAVFWALAQQIGSLMAGGYVAGRMRSRWHEAGDETEFRDGLHGGLVWAVAVLISAFFLFATASSGVRTGAEVASTASAASRTTNPMDTALDAMLRPGVTMSATNRQPSGTQTGAPQSRNQVASSLDEGRAELSRILANAVASGTLSADNRSYLANVVAERSGVSQQEAEKRVDDAISAARTAADKARRAAILAGFVTAAGLVLSLGAAWWSAIKGGEHRDNSVPARFQFDRRRRAAVS